MNSYKLNKLLECQNDDIRRTGFWCSTRCNHFIQPTIAGLLDSYSNSRNKLQAIDTTDYDCTLNNLKNGVIY